LYVQYRVWVGDERIIKRVHTGVEPFLGEKYAWQFMKAGPAFGGTALLLAIAGLLATVSAGGSSPEVIVIVKGLTLAAVAGFVFSVVVMVIDWPQVVMPPCLRWVGKQGPKRR
jgi:hypothetical protein